MYKDRIPFLDWLRVTACFMVMAIHAAENFYLGGEAPNVTFIASRADAIWVTITECICRVCVPLFVIASSYLLFPVSRPAGEFFKRRIARVFVPFAIWAVAYVVAADGDLRQIAFNFPDEGGHLWFVPRSWSHTLRVALSLWVIGAAIIGFPFYLYADKFPFSAPYSAAVDMEMSIEYCSIGVALTTIAAFLVLRKANLGGAVYRLFVRPISEASYGMYLMHMFILPVAFAALNPRLPTPLCILLTAAATFVASAAVATLIRRIPKLGKWIC